MNSVIMVIKLGAKIVKLTLGTYAIKTHLLNVVCAGMALGKSMNSVIMAIKLAVKIACSRLDMCVLGQFIVLQFVDRCLFAGTRSWRWVNNAIMATCKDVRQTAK